MINTANTRAVENHWGYPYNNAILKRKKTFARNLVHISGY